MPTPLRLLGLCLLLSLPVTSCGEREGAAEPPAGAVDETADAAGETTGEASADADAEGTSSVDIVFPTAEQMAMVPAELKTRLAAAMKSVCLHHTIRMVQEEHRYTSGNHLDAAERARRLGAPPLLERALRMLADEELPGPARSGLYSGVDGLYAGFGVDTLEIRLFVETSGIPVDFLPEVADWLPMEPLFNLPSETTPGTAVLGQQAETLNRLYPAIREQLASVHDTASAGAAAEVLRGMLATFASTQDLRLAPEQTQRQVFARNWQYVNSIIKELQTLRTPLQENEYYGSAKLRAVDYLLR